MMTKCKEWQWSNRGSAGECRLMSDDQWRCSMQQLGGRSQCNVRNEWAMAIQWEWLINYRWFDPGDPWKPDHPLQVIRVSLSQCNLSPSDPWVNSLTALLKTHFKKWDMRLKEWIWVSKNILQNRTWNSKDGSESQNTFSKMGYETQRQDLSLKTHFKKWDMRLKEWIWVSHPIFKNVLWDSNASFEFHIPFSTMCFEPQIHPLSFISHFPKCSLRLKYILWVSYPIFENVLWDSNPSFEFHIPFDKIFFETQIHSLWFICHFQKYSLRLKSILWVSYPIFQNILWDSNPSFGFHIPFSKTFFETQIHYLRFISHFQMLDLTLRSLTNSHLTLRILSYDSQIPQKNSHMTLRSLKKTVIWGEEMVIWDLRFEILTPWGTENFHILSHVSLCFCMCMYTLLRMEKHKKTVFPAGKWEMNERTNNVSSDGINITTWSRRKRHNLQSFFQ